MEQINLNIGTIGQKLESARRAKGVSVSEAGKETRILTKFIEAMESDEFGVLSAPVYVKGFIRMYATYLGLDPMPLIEDYLAQHAVLPKKPLPDEVKQNLAKADAAVPAKPVADRPPIFGGVNEAIGKLSGGFRLPRPTTVSLAWAGGALLAVLILLAGVTQCASSGDKEPAPVAGGAASVNRQLLFENQPEVYLVKPGEIAVKQK